MPRIVLKLFCSSKACLATRTDEDKRKYTNAKLTEHEYVDPSLDKQNGWKVDGIKTQGGCRDSAADYRTVRCKECGAISTGDFARD